jgi:2-C-methyl-D-erythritol 4-phosphate cytidylyltransferase/2-C-methyl-D-erythritol 2,4-cyclodiphosphate synthase
VTSFAAARRVWAIVPAAGRGERFETASSDAGATQRLPKQYAEIFGSSVLEWSLRALLHEARIEGIVVVLSSADAHGVELIASLNDRRLKTTMGGATRQESVMNGLKALESLTSPHDWILVHDAARPCLSFADVRALIDALDDQEHAVGCGAVLAAPIFDTIKRERDGLVSETVDRTGLWRALTPQVFGFSQLHDALSEAMRAGIAVTDEAQAMERFGHRPRLVQGSPLNIKVTRPEDLTLASEILRNVGSSEPQGRFRIGQGFDVHAFGDGNYVVLGGVRIAYHRGVVAHSDGDVIIHALCDAVLGALGAGDIGQHFPDSDPRHRGADSRIFLRRVAAMMRAASLRLVNADVTVLAEAPRIAAHRVAIAANLAADLGAAVQSINIKATTTERLGFVGRGEGLGALATVLLESQD